MGEALARSILDQAAEAIVVCDPAGRITQANPVALALCGHDPVGESFDTAFSLHEGRGPRPWHLLERRRQPRLGPVFSLSPLCQGKPIGNHPAGTRGVQVFFQRQDGTAFNLLLSAGPLTDSASHSLGCVITLTDVSECLRAEDDLAETQSRFRRLAESNIIGIIYADEDLVLEANDAFLAMVGYSREDLLARAIHWREMTPSEYATLTRDKLQELRTTGKCSPFEVEFIGKDGSRVPVLIGTVLFEAQPLQWVGFVLDLLPRRASEQALLEAKASLERRVRDRTAELGEINQALEKIVLEQRRTEEALRESRAEFQALVESAPDAIVSVNDTGQIVLVNSLTEKMFGYSREELLGMPVEILIPARYQHSHVRHRAIYQEFPSTRPMGIGLDLAGRRKDGTEFPVEISLSPIPTQEGGLVVSIIRDITERMRASQELKEQAQRLQEQANLIELAHDTIIVRDMRDRILFWNHGAEEAYGWSKEQAMGMVTHEFLKTESRESLEDIRSTLLDKGQWEGELVHATCDGNRITVSSRQVLQKNANGEPRAILEINRDITARKLAEEQLSESEARFRTLVQQVRDYAIFGLDPQGHVTSWNIGAERLNGYSTDEIVGKHFAIFFPPQDVAAGKPVQELRRAALEGRYEEEGKRVRKDGSQYWADVVVTALRDPNGNLRGFSKVLRDSTARKLAEEEIHNLNRELEQRVNELAAVNQELEAFSYSVSHDLRAPLRGIAGFSQALMEDYASVLDDEGKDYCRRINAATQRMTQLIDDMLALARVTRSEMSRESSVDLSGTVRSIAAQLQASQPERHVEFVIQDGLLVDADPRLLRVALENLVGNAWKFTSKVPAARIEFGAAIKSNGKPAYFVKDNGAGFDMAFSGKLFGPFQRLHSATEFPGTGIGLATVQRIIRRHGGQVWATSSVGQGAAFYFTLGD